MSEEKLSRRDTLKAGSSLAAVVVAGALSGCSGGGGTDTPTDTPSVETPKGISKLNFIASYNSTSGKLELTYSGTTLLSPENVYVRGDGISKTGSWKSLGGKATGDGKTMIDTFDTLTIDAQAEYNVRVVWEKEGTTIVISELKPGDGGGGGS